MKFLKVLTNALVCGLLFSFLLALLLANLNLNTQVTFSFFGRAGLRLACIYGLLAAVAAVFGFFIIQFFSGRSARLSFLSPPFLSLGFSLLILFYLVIAGANERHFASFFDEAIRRRLLTQTIILLFLGVGGIIAFFGQRRGRKPFLLKGYFLLLAVGLVLAFGQRPRFTPPASPLSASPLLGRKVEARLTVIGLDGLSFEFLSPLLARGRLPNVSWLTGSGTSGRLASFHPTEPVSLEGSFSTGKFPYQHGQFSGSRYRLWRMKQPLEIIPRFILFGQLGRVGFLDVSPAQPAARLKGFWEILAGNRILSLKMGGRAAGVQPASGPRAEKLLLKVFGSPLLADDPGFAPARSAFLRDSAGEEAASLEKSGRAPQVFYLHLDGLNIAQAYFFKYSRPQYFGDIDRERISRYGDVIEKYYDFYDELIGRYLTGMKEDELLVVYSAFGVEPLPLWKRLVERLLGDPGLSGHHETAPEGVVFFYGKVIRRGHRTAMRLVDIAPTLLYYLGLPVGRDMDGIVQSSLFLPEFTDENPVIYISSYQDFEIRPPE